MIPSKDTPSPRTMAFRYASLTLLTIYLTSMIVFVIWIGGVTTGSPGMRLDKDTVGVYGVRKLIRENGGFTIIKVDSARVAAKAGLRVGDKIVAVDSVEIKEDPRIYDLVLARAKMQVRVERSGHTEEVALVMEDNYLEIGVFLLPVFFIVGALIGWLRLGNSAAFECAIFFQCIAAASCDVCFQYLPDWGLVIGTIYSMTSKALWLPMGVRVFSVFPNPSRFGRFLWKWQWIFFLVPGLLALINYTDNFARLFGWQAVIQIIDPLNRFAGNGYVIFVGVVCVLGIALFVSQRKETRDSPQTRIKVIEFGFLTSAIAFGMCLVGIAIFLISGLSTPISDDSGVIVKVMFLTMMLGLIVGLFAIPFSFAYALLASKIFGIKFIVRKGLQYLFLSKGALVIEGIILFLILYQIISHGGTTWASSPMLVSGLSFGLGILGVFTLNRVNRKLMPAIDRRFFREALDVRKLLMDLNEQLSELREREKILQLTASTVLKALHPARVMMLLKHGKSDEFRCELTIEDKRVKLTQPEQSSPTRHAELVSASIQSNVQIPNRVRDDAGGGFVLKAEDSIIKQLEEKKGWAIVYPEKLNPEVEGDKRLLDLDCELFIAIQGSAGLVGIMALGGKLSEEPFSKEDRDLLTTVTRQMGLSLENAELLEVAKREAEQSRDLEIARSVQQNLFPKQLPVVAGWEFAGICNPAKAVGGDYYDIFEAVPGKVVVALGDVSGKGLGASFVMSGVHGSIRTRVTSCINEPLKLIEELNAYLLSSTAKNIFVTLFFGIIDLETGKLSYVNCGHPPAIVIRQEGNQQERLTRNGPGLSMIAGARFTQGGCLLQNGDTIVIYSDGVTEAKNNQEEMYEEERLSELLNNASGLEATAIMDKILKSVDRFALGAEQADDISVIVVRRC